MLTLTLKNFRGFVRLTRLPIRPLTLLVGENSSGKSTAMAALAAVFEPNRFPFTPNFNRSPFSLGSYDTIASYKGGAFGRSDTFSVGYDLTTSETGREGLDSITGPTKILATYSNRRGQPVLTHLDVTRNGKRGSLSLEYPTGKGREGTAILRTADSELAAPFVWANVAPDPANAFFEMFLLPSPGLTDQANSQRRAFFDGIIGTGVLFHHFSAVPISPLRSKPQRVYDQATASYDPEGAHIPFVLERYQGDADSELQALLAQSLAQFGEASGLFSSVRIRRLGPRPGSPFQVMVNLGGPARNLMDVGYGISQSLPLIVQSVLSVKSQILLLQQPEVHLHPRAQAALGTLFAQLAASGNHVFAIETHSDFLVDRVRQEIARGTIANTDVSLLFLRRYAGESRVYPVDLDSDGNVVRPPRFYRDFFLREEVSLLTRGPKG